MNQREIEKLKAFLMEYAQRGCKIVSTAYGVEGRVVGVGFKPFWTQPIDSKIEKLEFNVIDCYGRVAPFYLYNVIGCKIISYDGDRLDRSKKIILDMHLLAPNKIGEKEPYDSVCIEIHRT